MVVNFGQKEKRAEFDKKIKFSLEEVKAE